MLMLGIYRNRHHFILQLLEVSCLHNSIKILSILIEISPIVILQGYEDIVRALIEHGAKIDAETLAYSFSPLHYAASAGKWPSLTFIGCFFHLWSISYHFLLGQEKVVRTLAELGAKVDAEDKRKRTPLHDSAYYGKSLTHRFHFSLETFAFFGQVMRMLFGL